ncbi:DUF4229 domain-containing protein [Marmoricola endophyticus]|uniref:DUF4229 domain-containing protein n=1 Tax=Marmoricola endophyticus TaxID=2040280 RepID=UPI00166957F2|nr:DUF4229 domain-containing protein [Marmoricola endophyticus]
MKAFWSYTLMRIGLFVASFAVVWGVYAIVADRINLIVVVLLAAAISAVASWKLLEGPRERLAENVQARASRATERFEEMRSKEDAD